MTGRDRAGEPLPAGLGHVVSAPPFAPLAACVARLERAGVEVALGGSGLLAALSLADRVRDWDLTTDAPMERVVAALAGERTTISGNDALHADHKLMLADGDIEVIVGFAYFTPAGVVHIPTVVSERREGLPLASPLSWAVAYHLLGRDGKSETLFGWLETHGVDRGTRDQLLAEPLAPGIAARLKALPTSSTT